MAPYFSVKTIILMREIVRLERVLGRGAGFSCEMAKVCAEGRGGDENGVRKQGGTGHGSDPAAIT